MKKVLKTPINNRDLEDIKAGDIIYLDGCLITARDAVHNRVLNLGMELPIDLNGLAILHAGPIVKSENDKHTMISIGPTTSNRMEQYEREFIKKTGVKVIIGKGGMRNNTTIGCKENKAIHCVFTGGCAVVAAECVEEIEGVEWPELGMPEALWILKVKEFGPLIVSIDTHGNNLIEEYKKEYNENKEEVMEELFNKVKYIK